MTKVAILPVPIEGGTVSYRAVADHMQSEGKTAGEALDALTAQLTEDETGMMIIVQTLSPDRFLNGEQQQRLSDLMSRWRADRDSESDFPPEDQIELEALVQAELRASSERSRELADELDR